MAWRKAGKTARLYVAGRDFTVPARDARKLAAAAEVDGAMYAGLSEAGRDAVIELLGAGHYQLPSGEAP